MSSSTVPAHRSELEQYDTGKGTIRFQPDGPLPAALVRKLVRTRRGLTPRPDLWERYVTGPESDPDPAAWRTELNRPLE